ncbi:MAG: helix-hairpin-helix domain-containing protein [Chloroflexota bacterium]|nr:helix-hairpin-helix domain-containing protein [Chloroflexota bacterium]
MTKPWMLILFGALTGLLITGALILIARPNQGAPITLHPAPSPTPTNLPSPTRTPTPVLVQVAGAVHEPGVYALPVDSRLSDLISLAGGLTQAADVDRINQAAILRDGAYFYIPVNDEPIPETASNAPGASGIDDSEIYSYPLDLNQASQDELESLPGIGPSKATDILSYREEHGDFGSVDELVNVSGIGEATVDSLRDYLIVEGE